MVGKVFAARRKSAPDRRGRATASGELVAIKVLNKAVLKAGNQLTMAAGPHVFFFIYVPSSSKEIIQYIFISFYVFSSCSSIDFFIYLSSVPLTREIVYLMPHASASGFWYQQLTLSWQIYSRAETTSAELENNTDMRPLRFWKNSEWWPCESVARERAALLALSHRPGGSTESGRSGGSAGSGRAGGSTESGRTGESGESGRPGCHFICNMLSTFQARCSLICT